MLFRRVLICHVLHVSFSAASTAEVVKPEDIVGFVKGDNSRDTISLLISCLVTLGLCVYSAVHLNLPAKGERYFQTLWREFKWCIIGLFAPELVLYTAWRQFASAKQLCDEVRQARAVEGDASDDRKMSQAEKISTVEELSISTHGRRRHRWTLAHGFYGTMGGIAIDLDHDESIHANIFGKATRLSLTAKGVALLAQCGHLPDISVDDIKDKNKADSLAKLLVCMQAGWMIVQVICRRALDLPTSLLEVHTVAHVVCALLMYAIWWHKPRQVESPTVLRGEKILPLAAYMYSASRMSGQRPGGTFGKLLNPKPELKCLAYLDEKESNGASPREITVDRPTLTTVASTTSGRFIPLPLSPTSNHHQEREIASDEDEHSMERKRLAAEAVDLYLAIRSRFKRPTDKDMNESDAEYQIPYATELVQPYSLNWPNAGLLRRTQSLIMGMTLWGASMAYGAIHVSAWRYFFPTYAEKLLWHLSSVWVTFCAAFWLMIHLLAYVFPNIDRIWVAYNERRLGWFATGIITILCILCGVSFIGSRAYLVVEAFVSIREVPKAVYDTPSWSQVFPHL